jgi:FMN phosphatase YigB (HAD superfamily)
VLNKLKCHPENILFIDDNLNNLEAAQKTGINIIHFIDAKLTESKISEFNQNVFI